MIHAYNMIIDYYNVSGASAGRTNVIVLFAAAIGRGSLNRISGECAIGETWSMATRETVTAQ